MSAAAAPRIAIVGAGAAGLVCARELMQVGMQVVVFERLAQGSGCGGVWQHSQGGAMYRHLRTNLPKEVMAYIGHPYDPSLPSFVGHADVGSYLDGYATEQGVLGAIRWSSEVVAATPVGPEAASSPSPLQARLGGRFLPWLVTVAETATRAERTEQFDALLVCNGHFTLPDIPVYPGLDRFPGRVIHAVDYDDPLDLAGLSVLVVGTASSGTDIAWELTSTAASVAVSQRSLSAEQQAQMSTEPPAPGRAPLAHRGAIEALHSDGTVEFVGGERLAVDVVVLCTGYVYSIPFVQLPSFVPAVTTPPAAGGATQDPDEVGSLVGGGGRRVSWLWRQFLHAHIPSLCCIGLTYGIIPCQLFQCQALWLASLYTGALKLPDETKLVADVEQQYAEVVAQPGGWPRHAHRMGNGQWDYNRMLASEALAHEPERQQDFLRWINTNEEINSAVQESRPKRPGASDVYRDSEYTVDRQTGSWDSRAASL